MLSPRVGKGGGGVTSGNLIQRALCWVHLVAAAGTGIWHVCHLGRLRDLEVIISHQGAGIWHFSRCLGVGNLILASMKMSNSPGSACPPSLPHSLGLNIDRCKCYHFQGFCTLLKMSAPACSSTCQRAIKQVHKNIFNRAIFLFFLKRVW